ncbi:E3 ubiquitin-protein ligase RNF114 isoform X2 [Alligator mississippiensis]|uniref:E3 ubiquitin-protein ligase RNF114 isoform X2 n=1 Tax=Alligator mississippiensis TaxID=8496 RepID=UPI002877BFDB|nr:E3 ubiquitin-protein ligase RNF114 isoform X2 [Alligator mississippiensis]
MRVALYGGVAAPAPAGHRRRWEWHAEVLRGSQAAEHGGGGQRLPLPGRGGAARPAIAFSLPRVPGGLREPRAGALRTRMYLSKLRSHAASCSKYQNYIMEGVKAVTKEPPCNTRNVPNRFTFPCPYCSERNLDQEGLVEHCKKYHIMDAKQVVCPICASMPWGDPNYRSANFMDHLQRRHRFSYDTFVDYDADEDDMMAQVLLRSLRDK